MSDTPTYLTLPQLAKHLDVAPSTLYAQKKAGTFPYPLVRVGAFDRVPLEAVQRAERGDESAAERVLAALERDHAERQALRCELRAVAESMQAIFAGLATLFAAPTSPAIHSVPPTRSYGSPLGEEGGNWIEPRKVDTARVPERSQGGRGVSRADGGHRRQTAQRDGRHADRLATRAAD